MYRFEVFHDIDPYFFFQNKRNFRLNRKGKKSQKMPGQKDIDLMRERDKRRKINNGSKRLVAQRGASAIYPVSTNVRSLLWTNHLPLPNWQYNHKSSYLSEFFPSYLADALSSLSNPQRLRTNQSLHSPLTRN